MAVKSVVKFEFRSYCRRFKHGLQTNQGKWQFRSGIVLRLSDAAGRVGLGEIAPLSWFGSESLEEALALCHNLPTKITADTIFSIPFTLPACQFGFESAWEAMSGFELGQPSKSSESKIQGPAGSGDSLGHAGAIDPSKIVLSYSGLLPTGAAVLQAWQTLWNQGYRTFKWKIGVAPFQNEIQIFDHLVQALPTAAKLRLDANGRLSWQAAEAWLRACDQCELAKIEFLEQPLPVDQVEPMRQLSGRYSTRLALDESVATLDQLEACYRLGWQGIFVIKPAIAGSPFRLRRFCQQYNIDAVFSSVFETVIGRQQALKLAAQLAPNRAVGFGIDHWFDQDLPQPVISDPEQLWQSL